MEQTSLQNGLAERIVEALQTE